MTEGPRFWTRPIVLGDRFDRYVPLRANKSKFSRHDKLARRLLRKQLMRATCNPLDVEIHAVRQDHVRAARLASNSHEARRYVAADRAERRSAP